VENLKIIHNYLNEHNSYSNMNNNFQWTLVQSFLAALDASSLLGAAKALGTSQPTVGRHLAELETQLGAVLFERTGRGLRPTAAALAITAAAREMEAQAIHLSRTLSRAAQSEAGTVRITASQSVACELLPPILAAMRAALPQIQVEIVSSNAVSNLLRRDADIALRMIRPNQSSLIARKVAEISVGAYAHKNYLKRRGVPRSMQDLLSHELIGGDVDETIVRGFKSFGYPAQKELFALRSDDHSVQWQSVRAGLGIGFISAYVAAQDRDVRRVVPELKVPPLPVWLTVHREIRSNQRIRQVYDFLGDAVKAALA
jgi:DNA-binding transcriptional LysR family regulator